MNKSVSGEERAGHSFISLVVGVVGVVGVVVVAEA